MAMLLERDSQIMVRAMAEFWDDAANFYASQIEGQDPELGDKICWDMGRDGGLIDMGWGTSMCECIGYRALRCCCPCYVLLRSATLEMLKQILFHFNSYYSWASL